MTTHEAISLIRQTATIGEDEPMTGHQAGGAQDASLRRTAIAAGVLYLITHVTSVGSALLYGPVLSRPGYLAGPGSAAPVLLGALFELVLSLAVVGTAVALYPVVRRHHEGVALGYVGLRTLEAGIIGAGIIPLLAAVALRRGLPGPAGSDLAGLVPLETALVALHDGSLVLGPGFVCGANTVLMAYLMLRSHLVPRFIPMLGLVGGPLVFAYHAARLFGGFDAAPAWAALAVIPIFAWELSLAIWLIARGFNGSPAALAGGQP